MAKTKRIGLFAGRHVCECGRPALSRTTKDKRWVFRRDHDLCQRCFVEMTSDHRAAPRRAYRRPITRTRPEMSHILEAEAACLAWPPAVNDDRETPNWLAHFVIDLAKELQLDLALPA